MSTVALVVFLVALSWILYVYLLYPLLILALSFCLRRPQVDAFPEDELPSVSILIPAYNEEKILARKLENALELDYPSDKLEIVVVSDCSTDRTDEIAEGFVDRGVRYVRNEINKGKIATLSELGEQSSSDILLITDSNAIFERGALRNLVARFGDPRVGIVNGNKVLNRTDCMAGDGEGAYWVYETLLKRAESDVCSNAFVTGAMTAIRRELFFPVPSYLEFDHILPLHVVNEGRRVVFETDARFYEETAVSSHAEYNVRVRNAVRGFTMFLLLPRYLNPLKRPLFAWHVVSRKVLRWLIAVPSLMMLIANFFLLESRLFQVTLVLQLVFYGFALLALVLDRAGVKNRVLALPLYFCLVNVASLVGFLRALFGDRVATWRTER